MERSLDVLLAQPRVIGTIKQLRKFREQQFNLSIVSQQFEETPMLPNYLKELQETIKN